MKLYFIKPVLFIASFSSIIISGCLKDKDFDNGGRQPTHGSDVKAIEIKLTAANASNFFTLAVNNSANDTIVDLVPINLATANAASEDLHVTVDLDSTLVNIYNTDNGTAYAIPPSSFYTIVNPVVTIPKGSHTGYLQIKFKPSVFIGGSWALGFKITAIQETGYVISGNLNTGITALIVKNEYDGVYNAVGHFDHPVYAGDYNTLWACETSGISSVTFQLDVTVLFSVYVTLTVNPDNSVTVTADTPLDPYDPSKNYYTPADKTFHLDFGYSGGSRHLVGTATYLYPR